jgi:hypothetical protein
MSVKPPLKTVISTLHVDVGAQHVQHPLASPDYRGRPLFLRATSDGTTLKLDVSDQKTPDPGTPAAGARRAEITVVQDTTRSTWTIDPFTYVGGSDLELKMNVRSDLSEAVLFIRDKVADDENNFDLTYVLIEAANAGAPEPRLRLEWITDPISIEGGDKRTLASIVEPDPTFGGTLGPMGMATP